MPTSRAFALVATLVFAAILPLWAPARGAAPATDFPGWPTQFEGRPLRALALSESERRFGTSFPGMIGRFTDGQREIVIRWVAAPTRKLHASADCFRGSGYRVEPKPIATMAGDAWGRFDASKGHELWQVRETIVAASNAQQRWTDVSSWYWAALRAPSSERWWSFTVAASESHGGIATRAQFTASE